MRGQWLWGAALGSPRATLALAVLVVVLAGLGLGKLELATDGQALIPGGAAATATDRDIRAHFGLGDQIAVVVRTGDGRGIFNARTLRTIVDLTAALRGLPDVRPEDVQSLATERSDRVRTGTLDFRAWLDPLPTTDDALARLRRDLDDIGIYRGTLISADVPPSAAAVVLEVGRDTDRRLLLGQIEAVIEGVHGPDETLLVAGAPVAEATLGDHLLADLATLIPLSVLLLTIVFLLAFRRWAAVALAAVEVVAALVFTLGCMGWLGVPVYLTVAVLPVILVAVGTADELHVFTCFLRYRAAHPDESSRVIVERTMGDMAGPVVLTSVTTAIGFLAFATSPIGPVQVFGLFMALGVLFCLVWTLTVIPVALVLISPARLAAATSAYVWRWDRLGPVLLGWRRPMLFGVAAGVFVAVFGVGRLEVQDSWVGGFAPGSPLRRATADVERLFGGSHLLRVVVDSSAVELTGTIRPQAVGASTVTISDPEVPAGVLLHHRVSLYPRRPDRTGAGEIPALVGRIVGVRTVGEAVELTLDARGRDLRRWIPTSVRRVGYVIDGVGRLTRPAVLEQVGRLEGFVAGRTLDGVGRVVGPHEHLATMHFMLRLRDPAARGIPPTQALLDNTLEHYRRVRGEERLGEVIDAEARSGVVTVFLRDADFRTTAHLIEVIRDYETRELAPHGLSLRLAGDLAASQTMIDAVVRTQIASLVLSLVVIAVLLALTWRSATFGVLAVLPSALAVFGVFGAMGWLGVPLGVATSMFAAMVLGVGVDYGVHLLARVRSLLTEGREGVDAVAAAIALTAPAIVIDACAVGTAFGLLMLSRVAPTARLGGIVALTIALCVIMTLGVMPAAFWSASERGRYPASP